MARRRSAARSSRGVRVTIPVRWGDMDALNHVNNTMYFRYFESTRIAYLQAMGVDLDRRCETTGPGLVSAHINFRRQVRYPATLIASANVTAIGNRSISFAHVLRNAADDEIVADGTAVCVWMDYEAEKALPIPDHLVKKIARIERKPDLKRREKSGHRTAS